MQAVYAQAGKVTKFERLSIGEGLSQVSVKSIIKDDKGFIWIATQDGLNRYDGYQFKVYLHDPDDPTSLSDNVIESLHIDRKGVLWVGTMQGGLNQYDSKTDSFKRFKHQKSNSTSISSNLITDIFEDHTGRLWIGTDTGLNYYNNERKEFLRFHHDENDPFSLSDNKVWDIFEDKANNLWVGTNKGLNKFTEEKMHFKHFFHDHNNPNSLSNNSVRAIFEGEENVLWIGTYGGGLNRFDTSTELFRSYQYKKNDFNSLSHNSIWTLLVDQHGAIWIGTHGGGLNRFDPISEQFNHFFNSTSNESSLSSNNIETVYEDKMGIFWIGTQDGGLNKLTPQTMKFNHYTHVEDELFSLSNKVIWTILPDSQGNVWFGTNSKGLNIYDKSSKKFKHISKNKADPLSIDSKIVLSSFEDKEKRLWFGTYTGGLYLYNPKNEEFTNFRHDPNHAFSLSSDINGAITQTHDGSLWVASTRGLNKFNPEIGGFHHYKHDENNKNSLSHNYVRSISEGENDELWIGTNKGLNKFNVKTEKFTHYIHDSNDPKSLSDNRVWAVLKDSSGTIWIGTANGGLNKFDSKTETFINYRKKQGIANDSIYGIVEDDLGHLWISTNKGLSKFDIKAEKFINYTVNDGLQSDEFNMGSYIKAQDGELFFGGINGFNRFYPENIKENNDAPKVVINDFLLFNKSVPLKHKDPHSPLEVVIAETDSLTLNYTQAIFSFEFVALHFLDPRHNQYAYKLEGFDNNWITTSANKRFATYTNIDAGEYIFKVKASNKDGVWNEQGASVKVIILPPPWKSWWAYLLYLLAILSIIFRYIYVHRTEKMRLETLVKERTKELAKLTTAVEQSPASVMIMSLGGSIEYVNPKFCEITGYKAGSVFGKHALYLSAKEDTNTEEDIWQTLATGKEWHGEFLNKKKDGTLFWESSMFSPIYSDDGNVTHYLAVKEDITDRKAMETQLKEAKSTAEEATRTKSDFLANMSHEIRTPMNAIIGMSHLALQTALNRKQKDYVNKINTAANSLLGIINDILDFSKIEAGKMDMEAVPFSLNESLSDLTQLIMVKIQEQGLELLIDRAVDVPDGLVGDSLRLRQILINLANNAVKFTHEGEIIIRIEQQAITSEQVTLKFSIIDSGIGMSEAQMSKLFQSFSQADTSTTRKYGGTGLGLTISKTLTEMMGGAIWVESTVDVGSSFCFTANFGLSNEVTSGLVQPTIDLRGLRILVVDDSASAREIMQHLSDSLTFDTEVVASGEEALERIAYADSTEQAFDIVFMDWKMPSMSGIEAYHSIKNNISLKQPPKVVMVTAYDKDEMLRGLDGEQTDGFLSKPVSASSLYDTAMMVMGHKQDQVIKSAYELELEAVSAIRGAKILLVDDNEINQQVGQELLELAQMVVSIASNGQEAIDKIQANDFDLVLMDIQMPVMDGYTATQVLRKNPAYKTLPIVAMTANALTTDKEKCLAAGMNEHVAKPIDPNILYRTLAQWITPKERDIPVLPPQDAAGEEETITDISSSHQSVTPSSLLHLPGFDVDRAVLRMGGNTNAYKKVLSKVLTTEADAIDRLTHSLEAGEDEMAIRIAHTLKSVAGTIGAKVLQESAAALERELIDKNGALQDKQEALIAQTKQALVEALGLIKGVLQTEETEQVTEQQVTLDNVRLDSIQDAALIEALAQILTSVKNYDATVETAVDELLESLDEPSICQLLEKLRCSLAEYNFDAAAEQLVALLPEENKK